MDNQELMKFFDGIDAELNCFNKTELLKQNKKAYKNSDFYKKTHLSIVKAYKIYQASKLQNLYWIATNPLVIAILKGDKNRIAIELEDMIESFDFTKLDGIFNYIIDKINKINTTDLREELQFVTDKIQKMLPTR